MIKRFQELSFIIGIFFILLSLILIGGYFLSAALKYRINIYAGAVFLVFGIMMILVKSGEKNEL